MKTDAEAMEDPTIAAKTAFAATVAQRSSRRKSHESLHVLRHLVISFRDDLHLHASGKAFPKHREKNRRE
ncbi:hypothetical protein ACFLQ0_04560 [Nitrospinota bacterium]